MPGVVKVYKAGVKWEASLEENLNRTIPKMVKEEKGELDALSVVLMSDEALLDYNINYLKHTDYTDVITFDLAEEDGRLNGEIYVSVDRVKENAKAYKELPNKEMMRVIIHGTLHLLGYRDKSGDEKAGMREKEDYYLDKYGFTWNSSMDGKKRI